ncbi:MAG: methyltransferase domain-containing protein [Desulfobacterales bacterium]
MRPNPTRPTPFAPSSIDIVYISTAIHTFSRNQMADYLNEVKRILKPAGRLAIVEIEKETFWPTCAWHPDGLPIEGSRAHGPCHYGAGGKTFLYAGFPKNRQIYKLLDCAAV